MYHNLSSKYKIRNAIYSHPFLGYTFLIEWRFKFFMRVLSKNLWPCLKIAGLII